MQTHAPTHTQTHSQAKEEGELLRTLKQKDVFRTVHSGRETKKGSSMTLHSGHPRVTSGLMDTPI